MASSSNKQNIQTALNFNYQKELGELFTENKDLQRQVTELNKNQDSAVMCGEDSARQQLIKKQINSKPESSEMNRRLIQGEKQFSKIATYTQQKFLKLQSNGNPNDIETEQLLVYKQRRIHDAGFAREEGIQSDNVGNSLKSKRQKKQNIEIKQFNYTAHNKDKYIKENSTNDGRYMKQQQKQTILE